MSVALSTDSCQVLKGGILILGQILNLGHLVFETLIYFMIKVKFCFLTKSNTFEKFGGFYRKKDLISSLALSQY